MVTDKQKLHKNSVHKVDTKLDQSAVKLSKYGDKSMFESIFDNTLSAYTLSI